MNKYLILKEKVLGGGLVSGEVRTTTIFRGPDIFLG